MPDDDDDERVDNVQERSAVLATRMMWHEFPEIRDMITDREKAQAMVEIMLSAFSEAAAESEKGLEAKRRQARAELERLEKTKAAVPEVPRPRPATGGRSLRTSKDIKPESHIGRLLAAFAADHTAGGEGLTDQEAFELSKLPSDSCYWKRAGDLRTLGYLERVYDADGKPKMHYSRTSMKQRKISAITPEGRKIVHSWSAK